MNEQREKLSVIEKVQEEEYDSATKEQSAHWEKITGSLEEEKTVLNEQVSSITQKVKFSYIMAGGAAVLTIVQLFLNVLGVL